MIKIPDIFKQKIKVTFPPHVRLDLIEEYAEKYFASRDTFGYEYLPIHWCAWHVNNGYGREVETLRRWVRENVPKGKYFTTVQYDGGTLIDNTLDEIGVLRFCCDGERLAKANSPNNVWIPLLCDPHPVKRLPYNECVYLASFVGSFGTHPVRKRLREVFQKRPGYYCECVDTNCFRNVLRASKFAFCPRGSGITSFRLYEAIQIGCVPVYISDYFAFPFSNKINWNRLAVLVPFESFDDIHDILSTILENTIESMREYGQECYKNFFTMEKTCEEILNILKAMA